jgi:hypothetical protein
MQTCSQCGAQSPDTVIQCVACQADLRRFSTTAQALFHFQNNPRVMAVRLSVAHDACPVCQQMQGTYPKDKVPLLPVEGCSDPDGCRCFYDPVLTEIYP